jgi:hypothetical protein
MHLVWDGPLGASDKNDNILRAEHRNFEPPTPYRGFSALRMNYLIRKSLRTRVCPSL